MKKCFIALSIVLLSGVFSVSARVDDGKPRLSPSTQLFLKSRTTNPLPADYVYRKDSRGNICVAGMVKVKQGINEAAIETLGVSVGTKAGAVWTVSVPLHAVEQFVVTQGIEYIELDIPLAPDMDAARKVTKTDSVHGGYAPLTMPYTGKNVVVGIIDAGFDYNHPTTKDTSGAVWRIKKVWEQKKSGTAPTGFTYGNEITSSSTMQTVGTDMAQFSHGAHVAGIASGSGYGSADKQYKGIAFESDMVFVGITPDSTQWMNTGMSDIIDGMNYIYNYAASVSKPAVVNLSWGCTVGPHDGNSLFSQACDALTRKGKLFVCSGGNNGTNNVHLAKNFTATDTLIRTELVLPTGKQNTWVDIWGDTAKAFCINVALYNGVTQTTNTGFICLDNQAHTLALIGSDGDTSYINMVTESPSFNGKPRTFLSFNHKTADRIVVAATGIDGAIDMWTGYVEKVTGQYGGFTGGLPGTVTGNNEMTVGDMACTKSAIAVASFASNISFTNLLGQNISYASYVPSNGRLAPYSSRGPSADMRTKPDIAAPGLMIGSGVSTFDDAYMPTGINADHLVASYLDAADGKTYYYAMLTGTSMSSPVVAGIVALMLQANPNLTPTQVQQILKSTAMHDGFTGARTANGSNMWGHGKVNAFAAVAQAIQYASTQQLAASTASVALYPNPNTGAFVIEYDNTHSTENIQITIADISGKVLVLQHATVNTGKNLIPCNAQGYSAGLYIVRVASVTQGSNVLKMVVR